MSSPLISFESVSYRYPGADGPALDNLSVDIHEGEFCLLAGMTGEGKSTLLRAACGLVPHFHGGTFSGAVTVAGRDTHAAGPAELGAFVGVLFQDPETQLVMSSVKSELSLALEARGHGAVAAARGVEEVALALGIDHLLDRSTTELSGGEKQRVALGAALVGSPRIVLLDEPTSQLDPVAGDELIGLLRRLNRDWDLTIVLSEHRLERCLGDVDRVIGLRAGGVVHDGDPKSFLRWSAQAAPALQTPGARMFSLAGLAEVPVDVKGARRALRALGLPGQRAEIDSAAMPPNAVGPARVSRRPDKALGALRMRGVWHELPRGRAILRGVTLDVGAGESVAVMGRNGSGKSTLLRHAAGLLEPTRGKIERTGRVALLLQNPGDYFLHERVAQELSAEALAAAGLAEVAQRNPRDLSGGERQRLALAIVTAGADAVVLALDEPTRGMDRQAKAELADALRARAQAGQAVIVATHDPEFAAACADRALLMADGRVVADGSVHELLSGGWYFATETARILGGGAASTLGGSAVPLLPEQGARLLLAATHRTGAAAVPVNRGEVRRRVGAAPLPARVIGS